MSEDLARVLRCAADLAVVHGCAGLHEDLIGDDLLPDLGLWVSHYDVWELLTWAADEVTGSGSPVYNAGWRKLVQAADEALLGHLADLTGGDDGCSWFEGQHTDAELIEVLDRLGEAAAEAAGVDLPKQFRVLVTGSRSWTDADAIRSALDGVHVFYGDLMVVVHGGCRRGADAIADRWAKERKVAVETYPADWKRHGRRAGLFRNDQMVATGPDLCLAFIANGSPGASHCASLARHAGIHTTVRRTGGAG